MSAGNTIFRQSVMARPRLLELASSPNGGQVVGAGTLQPPTASFAPRPPTPTEPRFDILPPAREGDEGASSPGAVIGDSLVTALGTTVGSLVLGGVGVAVGLTAAYFIWGR